MTVKHVNGRLLSKSVDGNALYLRISKEGELKTSSILVNDDIIRRYAINKLQLGDFVEMELDETNTCTFLKHRDKMMFAAKYL